MKWLRIISNAYFFVGILLNFALADVSTSLLKKADSQIPGLLKRLEHESSSSKREELVRSFAWDVMKGFAAVPDYSLLESTHRELIQYIQTRLSIGGVSQFTDFSHEIPIIEDPAGWNMGTYLYPNESKPHHFQKAIQCVQPGGTLISVGSIRTLIDAGMGQFDRVILMDFDSKTSGFNKIHLSLLNAIGQIQLSPKMQRYQYFAALHCRWFTYEQLRELDKANLDSDAFFSKFDQLFPKEEVCNAASFPLELQPFITQLQKMDIHTSKNTKLLHQTLTTELGLLSAYYPAKERTPFYWENDQSWEKIQKLIRAKRIGAFVGDLWGKKTMQSLGTFLKKNDEQVAILDVSNAMEHIDKISPEISFHDYNQFISNLRNLPWQNKAFILRTTKVDIPGTQNDGNWHYFYQNPTPYLQSGSINQDVWFRFDSAK